MARGPSTDDGSTTPGTDSSLPSNCALESLADWTVWILGHTITTALLVLLVATLLQVYDTTAGALAGIVGAPVLAILAPACVLAVVAGTALSICQRRRRLAKAALRWSARRPRAVAGLLWAAFLAALLVRLGLLAGILAGPVAALGWYALAQPSVPPEIWPVAAGLAVAYLILTPATAIQIRRSAQRLATRRRARWQRYARLRARAGRVARPATIVPDPTDLQPAD
jgi:hypothetical protein